jgi:hypothetical protein
MGHYPLEGGSSSLFCTLAATPSICIPDFGVVGSSQIAAAMATQQAIASCGVTSEFWGSQGRLRSNEAGKTTPGKSAGVVRMAISRKKKEETVENARKQLEGCMLVAGIKYTGLSVKHMQQLRKALPEQTTLMVAKNKLIGTICTKPQDFSIENVVNFHG